MRITGRGDAELWGIPSMRVPRRSSRGALCISLPRTPGTHLGSPRGVHLAVLLPCCVEGYRRLLGIWDLGRHMGIWGLGRNMGFVFFSETVRPNAQKTSTRVAIPTPAVTAVQCACRRHATLLKLHGAHNYVPYPGQTSPAVPKGK